MNSFQASFHSPQLRILSDDQILSLYQATLACLHRTGVEVHHQEARRLLHDEDADYAKAASDFVAAGVDFFRSHPKMGATVLECTGFPSLARALQREIDIPLFSWGTLLDFAYSITVHRDYYGHV